MKAFLQHARHWLGILGVLAISVLSMNLHFEAGLLHSSILSTPEHTPFDGTVYPIQASPDWTHLTSEQYHMSYSEIPADKYQPTHEYRNDWFTFPSSQLVWGNAEHDRIRNSKITFSVPYAGHYSFDDCGENCGSHPAVDWKAPEGTPVHAIANGKVIKAGTSSGFGYTVVLEHQDAPMPDNPSVRTTLYTTYSHLSSFSVAQGDIVTKGEVIGEVGDTGTATTHHLHLGGDYSQAPFHPYWPFTTSEATAAGLDFFSAVNAGLGKDNMYAYTFNVMDWIKDNLDGAPIEIDAPSKADDEEETVATEEEETSAEVKEEMPEITENPEIDFSSLDLEGQRFIMLGDEKQLTLTLLDEQGNVVKTPQFEGELELSLSDSSLGTLSQTHASANDFNSKGEFDFTIYAERKGDVNVQFQIYDRNFASPTIHFIDSLNAFFEFGVVTDGSFVPGVAETFQVQSLDIHGDPTPSFQGDGTIELGLVEGSGTFSKTRLTEDDFENGIAEVTFTGNSDETAVIQAVYGTEIYESNALRATLFTDLDDSYEFYDAVRYFQKKGTVKGYTDGSFQPERTVSRAEALKMIQMGMDQNTKPGVSLPFPDLEKNAWYLEFVGTAYDAGVIQGYPDGLFRPHNGVTRAEFAKMLVTTLDLSIDPVVLEKPYEDVDTLAWYAPIVSYVNSFNLFPVDGDEFRPNQAMSRGEVVEMLYRLTAVVQNGEEPYSVLLKVN